MLLLLCILLVTTAIANPVPKNISKLIVESSSGNAVDFSIVATKTQFYCLRDGGYSVAFVRAYYPVGQGRFDNNSIININNAYAANIGTHVYISPLPLSTKSGSSQLTETYNGLVRNGIKVDTIWLQVVSSSQWSRIHTDNIHFIQSYMNQLTVLGITGGIYTSSYDWTSITNKWTGASHLALWYHHVYGNGLSNESPPNYGDFISFGGWYSPVAKQFAQSEAVCGVAPLNRDVIITEDANKMDMVRSVVPNVKL